MFLHVSADLPPEIPLILGCSERLKDGCYLWIGWSGGREGGREAGREETRIKA